MTAPRICWPHAGNASPTSSEHPRKVSAQPLAYVGDTFLTPSAISLSSTDMQPRIMYIELKSGYNDNGPAWVGRVRFSKTGTTIYYRNLTLQKIRGGGPHSSNYRDTATGDEYWVSGVKKNRHDRHWAGSGPVELDPDVREEYNQLTQ